MLWAVNLWRCVYLIPSKFCKRKHRIANSKDHSFGQATVELAFVLPFIMFLVFMGLDCFTLERTSLNVEHFAFLAARKASISLQVDPLSKVQADIQSLATQTLGAKALATVETDGVDKTVSVTVTLDVIGQMAFIKHFKGDMQVTSKIATGLEGG